MDADYDEDLRALCEHTYSCRDEADRLDLAVVTYLLDLAVTALRQLIAENDHSAKAERET